MARTKVFDPEQALDAALALFWERGYQGASTDELLRAMGIGRQSLYDTFGDKKQLYLAALDRYTASGGAVLRRRLAQAPSPLDGIAAFLREIAAGDAALRARGCLSVNAIAEFGQGDPEVAARIAHSERVTEQVFGDALARAAAAGELRAGLDPAAAAHFLHTLIRGLRISAKAGAGPEQMGASVEFGLAALRPSA